jgi:hypothetical protein
MREKSNFDFNFFACRACLVFKLELFYLHLLKFNNSLIIFILSMIIFTRILMLQSGPT